MKLTVLAFAGLSELLGQSTITIDIERNPITIRMLKQTLIERYPEAGAMINSSFAAKNHAYADLDETISETDELALIPPVSGG